MFVFALDAGANVHVLYPYSEKTEIEAFIKNILAAYCQKNHYICDSVGFGAETYFNLNSQLL